MPQNVFDQNQLFPEKNPQVNFNGWSCNNITSNNFYASVITIYDHDTNT